ncbi:MAG TPA: M15 family metallopeptidase, partial [Myxococcaceae bacterium]
MKLSRRAQLGLAAGAALVLLMLLTSRKALGYVAGKSTPIELAPIPGGWMRKDAAEAFNRMHAAARAEGVTLKVNSSFRSMEEQERLYAEHLAGTRPTPVAKPGHSNHQGGTAVDVETVNTNPSVDAWLSKNAGRFAFTRPIAVEPWHLEYRPATNKAQTPGLRATPAP